MWFLVGPKFSIVLGDDVIIPVTGLFTYSSYFEIFEENIQNYPAAPNLVVIGSEMTDIQAVHHR